MTSPLEKRTAEKNAALLSKLKKILPELAYRAAKKASKEGQLALRVDKNPNGKKIVQVVAVKAGEIGRGAYHKRDRGAVHSALYNLQPTTVDIERIGAKTQTLTKNGKDTPVKTWDAQPALFKGGSIENIKAFFSNKADEYAIFYRSSTEFTGQDEDEWDAATLPEGQRVGFETGPVFIYVGPLALMKANAKEYTSIGSLGDVIAEVAINVIEFGGGAAGELGEATSQAGEIASNVLEVIGGAKDAKKLHDDYFKGEDEKSPSLWNRRFVEENLQLEVCLAASESEAPAIVLASDETLTSEILEMDGKQMLGVSLGKVGRLIPGLLQRALRDLEKDVTGKRPPTTAERRRMFAEQGRQPASRNFREKL